MEYRTHPQPELTLAGVGVVVITARHVGEAERTRQAADAAVIARQTAPRPAGLLSWSLLTSTDGQSLLAYEQWEDDAALDAALSGTPPWQPGIPGTEPSAPDRYRLHRSTVSQSDTPVGCVVTPVFAAEGPERQRRFVEEIFTVAADAPPVPGAISAHFHLSADGTRVLNYAEWADEQSHLDAVTAPEGEKVRRRASQEVPGVRPAGYRRWFPHHTLVAG